MNNCKFCGSAIFWQENNGKNIPYEDSHKTIVHKCPKLPQKKSIADNDHLLLTQTISRVSALERVIDELKENWCKQ